MIFTRFLLILIFVSGCLTSCKKQQKNTVEQYSTILDSTSRIKTLVPLTPLKKEAIALQDNASFFSLKESATKLNTVSYAELDIALTSLNEAIEELPATLSEKYSTKGILSRLKEIETYTKQTTFLLQKRRKDTVVLKNRSIKILEAYNHLMLQINEMSNTLSDDFKKQLAKDKKIKKDSIDGVEPLF